MAYEALARRWRPRKFDDMLGQEHVLRALTNALDQDRLHHAYLFTGTRGVGKTTIARIFAKSLNCENGVSSTPCGECSACTQVDEGRFLDLIEVDAASRTGVDDTRELLDNVAYAPGSGRYKVYLIDEVHMFSKSSFNALLKTLEEPPPHVKFLLATTDPQKLPVTVLSRCLQFNLKAMPDQLLRPYLGKLLDSEKVTFEEAAIAHIAQAADGSVRDALSLLDQAIAYGQGKIQASEVEAMLGRFSPSRLYDLLGALASGQGDQIFNHVEALAEYVPDYSYVLGELLSLFHQVAMLQTVDKISLGEVHDEERLREFATAIPVQDIQLWYQIGLLGRRDLPFAPDHRQALEMTLIRMLAFKPVVGSVGGVVSSDSGAAHSATPARPATTGNASGSRGGSASASRAEAVTPAANATQASGTPRARSNTQPQQATASATASATEIVGSAAPGTEQVNASAPVKSAKKRVAPAAPEPAEQAVEENAEEPLPPANLSWEPKDWPDIVASLPVSGMPMQLARNCILASAAGDRVHLQLDPEYHTLAAPRWKERLRVKMSAFAGGEIQLKVEVPKELSAGTPAVAEKQAENARLESARTSIEQDPVVQEICKTFDGTVSTGSIKPVDPDPTPK